LNIFAVHQNPIISAQSLCDRHVVKMILETAQMITSVAERHNYPIIYKAGFKKHPCTIWSGDSIENWLWLIEHGIALNEEKKYRFSSGDHSSVHVIKWHLECFHAPKPHVKMTKFAQAMPDVYKDANHVNAYRNYYLGAKQYFKDGKRPTWTKRGPPDWWVYESQG